MKSRVALGLKLLLVLATLLIVSSSVTAITDSEFESNVRKMVAENMTASNFTYQDNAYFVMYRIMRLEQLVLQQGAHRIDLPPLEQRLEDTSRIINGLRGTTTQVTDQLSDHNEKISNLQIQVSSNQHSLDEIQKAIVNLPQGGISNLLTTLGTSFKSLGESLLRLSGDSTQTSTPNNPQSPLPSPIPSPALPISADPELKTPGRYWVDRDSEPGQDLPLAFDRNANTFFAKQYGASYPVAIYVDFNQPTSFSAVQFTSRRVADDLLPDSFTLMVSDDNSVYTPVSSYTLGRVNSGFSKKVAVSTNGNHRYFKIHFPSGSTLGDRRQLQVAEILFYN